FRGVVRVSYNLYIAAVNLPNCRERAFARKRFQEPTPVLLNIFVGVFAKTGEVQVARGKRRNAAETGGKSILKTCVHKRAALQNPNTIRRRPIKSAVRRTLLIGGNNAILNFRNAVFDRYRHNRSLPHTRNYEQNS